MFFAYKSSSTIPAFAANNFFFPSTYCLAQSAEAVEYTAFLQKCKIPPNECPGYDVKQSDSGAPVILELWGMQSIPSLPLLSAPL